MATTILIDIADIGANYADGDHITFQAPALRQSSTNPDRLVSTAAKVAHLHEGKGYLTLEPGPAEVFFYCRNITHHGPHYINIPDSGTHTLATLIAENIEYTPALLPQIASLTRAAQDAVAKAEAISGRLASVEQIETWIAEAENFTDAGKHELLDGAFAALADMEATLAEAKSALAAIDALDIDYDAIADRLDTAVGNQDGLAGGLHDLNATVGNLTTDAMQAMRDAQDALTVARNTAHIGQSLLAVKPGTSTPLWADTGATATTDLPLPEGVARAYRNTSQAPTTITPEQQWVTVSPYVQYRITFWAMADATGSDFALEMLNQDDQPAFTSYTPDDGTPHMATPANPILVKDMATQWTRYSGTLTPSEGSEMVYISRVSWPLAGKSGTRQYIAGLSLTPDIVGTGDLDSARKDTATAYEEAVKAWQRAGTAVEQANDVFDALGTVERRLAQDVEKALSDASAAQEAAEATAADAKAANDALAEVNENLKGLTTEQGAINGQLEGLNQEVADAQADAAQALVDASAKAAAAQVAAEEKAKELSDAAAALAAAAQAQADKGVADAKQVATDLSATDSRLTKAAADAQAAAAQAVIDAGEKAAAAQAAAEEKAKELSDAAAALAAAAQARADKGVADAKKVATDLSTADARLSKATSDAQAAADQALIDAEAKAAAAQSAAEEMARELSDAAAALATAAQAQADRGVADAKQVAVDLSAADSRLSKAASDAQADATQALIDASAKAAAAQTAAEKKAKELSDAAKERAKELSDAAAALAVAAQAQADKGVADAKKVAADLSTADTRLTKAASDAHARANAAYSRADAGVKDAKTANDALATLNDEFTAKVGAQGELTRKVGELTTGLDEAGKTLGKTGKDAQEALSAARAAANTIDNTVDIGNSLLAYEPGTDTPSWTVGEWVTPLAAEELPEGATRGWKSNYSGRTNLPKRPVAVSPNVTYKVTAWIRADESIGAFLLGATSPNLKSTVTEYKTIKGPSGWWSGGSNSTAYVLQFRNPSTEWEEYEAHIRFDSRVDHVWIEFSNWSHVDKNTHRNTTHYIADLRIEPIIPSQADVDEAQNLAIDALAEVDEAQNLAIDALAEGQKFQQWVNDNQVDWNAAQEKINAATSNFQSQQLELNAMGAEIDEAQNDAIAANTRLLNMVFPAQSAVPMVPGGHNVGTKDNPTYVQMPTWATPFDWVPITGVDGVSHAATVTGPKVSATEYANTVAVDPSIEYKISFWARAEDPGSHFIFVLRDQDGAGAVDRAEWTVGDTYSTGGFYIIETRKGKPLNTGWTKYEGTLTFQYHVREVYPANVYWSHSSGVSTQQWVADLQITPNMPSQRQVDDAQTKAIEGLVEAGKFQSWYNDANDGWKAAQEEINTLTSEVDEAQTKAIGALTEAAKFQSWYNDRNEGWKAAQEEINSLTSEVDDAQTKAIGALTEAAKFQTWYNDTNEGWKAAQEEINTLTTEVDDAQTKAIGALTEAAKFQTWYNDTNEGWKAAQEEINTLTTEVDDAQTKAIGALTEAGKFQSWYNDTNEGWKAAQEEINALTTGINDAQTKAIDALIDASDAQVWVNKNQRVWNETQSAWNDAQTGWNAKQQAINELDVRTDEAQNDAIAANSAAIRLAFPHLNVLPLGEDGKPTWTKGLSLSTMKPTAEMEADVGGGDVYLMPPGPISDTATFPHNEGIAYRISLWAMHYQGSSRALTIRLYDEDGEFASSRYRHSHSDSWNTSNFMTVSPSATNEWSRREIIVEVLPGVRNLKITLANNAGTNKFRIYGFRVSAYMPVQEQIDAAQNQALEALEEGQAAQKTLNENQEKWNDGVTAALATQKLVNGKQDEWNSAATEVITATAEAAHANSRILAQEFPPQSVVPMVPGGVNMGTDLDPNYVAMPAWLAAFREYERRTDGSLPDGNEWVAISTRRENNTADTENMVQVDQSIEYKWEFWFKADRPGSGLVLYLRDQNGNAAGEYNNTDEKSREYSTVSDHLWWNNDSMPGGDDTWHRFSGVIKFKSGVKAIRTSTFYLNYSRSDVITRQEITGLSISPNMPSQADVDKAQDKAIQTQSASIMLHENQIKWMRWSTPVYSYRFSVASGERNRTGDEIVTGMADLRLNVRSGKGAELITRPGWAGLFQVVLWLESGHKNTVMHNRGNPLIKAETEMFNLDDVIKMAEVIIWPEYGVEPREWVLEVEHNEGASPDFVARNTQAGGDVIDTDDNGDVYFNVPVVADADVRMQEPGRPRENVESGRTIPSGYRISPSADEAAVVVKFTHVQPALTWEPGAPLSGRQELPVLSRTVARSQWVTVASWKGLDWPSARTADIWFRLKWARYNAFSLATYSTRVTVGGREIGRIERNTIGGMTTTFTLSGKTQIKPGETVLFQAWASPGLGMERLVSSGSVKIEWS